MRIDFCGADRTVTGSSHLVRIGGHRVLLDCGLFQGRREEARVINQTLPLDVTHINAVVLSHGHLDHCGKLPLLVKRGYRGPIFATPATIDVARIVLLDSAEIQEEDAAYLNRRSRGSGEPLIAPLYTTADVHSVLKLFQRHPYNQRADLGDGIGFTFFDAGHILGSAYVIMDWNESTGGAIGRRTLLFTADVGRKNTPILRDPVPLSAPVDHVITESTYGGRRHGPMEDVEGQLKEAVQQIVRNRGRLIVPSFAVGRTQTMMWYFTKLLQQGDIPPLKIYVDSPMGVEVSQITSQHTDLYDDETVAMMNFPRMAEAQKLIKFASTGQQSREINADPGPCVIIASSPTCEFGRVLHHLKFSVERPNDIVIFTGWIPPNTLGRRLQDGERRVRIFERFFDVRCQIRTLHGLSAHADGDELLEFLTPALSKTTQVHVVHGEPDQAEALAMRIAPLCGAVTVPAMKTTSFGGVR